MRKVLLFFTSILFCGCSAVETNLFLSGRYEIKKKIFALLFLEQGFFLSDFICITLSELYRKSADIFPDSRAYIATFFVLLYPD